MDLDGAFKRIYREYLIAQQVTTASLFTRRQNVNVGNEALTLSALIDYSTSGSLQQVATGKYTWGTGATPITLGTSYTGINTSDVVPPAYYLVIVENKGGACGSFSGAWPVGFLRAGGSTGGTPGASCGGFEASRP